METWDLIVLGGGPAGLSAALVASNNGLRVVLVEASERLGGQLYHADAPIVDVLGRHEVMGGQLAEVYSEHLRARRVGATAVEVRLGARVARVELGAPEPGMNSRVTLRRPSGTWTSASAPFPVRSFPGMNSRATLRRPSGTIPAASSLDVSEVLEARRILLATGLAPRRLDVPGADLADPVADPRREHARFVGRRVVVVGGGDESASLARDLADVGVHVTLLARSRLRARPLFAEPLARAPAVEVRQRARVESLVGAGAGGGDGGAAMLGEVVLDSGARLDADAAFVRIGWAPSLPEIEPAPARHADGHLVVDGEGRTTCAALFAAGDLVRPSSQRYITAALADGAIAARAIEMELAGSAS